VAVLATLLFLQIKAVARFGLITLAAESGGEIIATKLNDFRTCVI
jgi:hypothetical protein